MPFIPHTDLLTFLPFCLLPALGAAIIYLDSNLDSYSFHFVFPLFLIIAVDFTRQSLHFNPTPGANMGTLDYHNFSIKGDPRWASASRFTLIAPLVVLTLFFLSIVQICIGAVWIVDLGSDMTMYVALSIS